MERFLAFRILEVVNSVSDSMPGAGDPAGTEMGRGEQNG